MKKYKKIIESLASKVMFVAFLIAWISFMIEVFKYISDKGGF